jgi:hypothetical protein
MFCFHKDVHSEKECLCMCAICLEYRRRICYQNLINAGKRHVKFMYNYDSEFKELLYNELRKPFPIVKQSSGILNRIKKFLKL